MRKTKYTANPPYIMRFSETPKVVNNVKGKLPKWCRLPVSNAEEAICYQFAESEILSQRLNRLHFSANVVEIHTNVPFDIPFQVNEDQLFFLYMLEGGIEFSTEDDLFITKAQEHNFYLSHNGPGIYKAHLEAGEHAAVVVAIRVNWAEKNFREFENLHPLLQEMLNATQLYNIMPHCRIDKQVEQWLTEAISTPHTNNVVQDSTFRMFISLTLERYDQLLAASQGMLAYKVKQYIDQHYTDHDLKYNKLASLYYITVRTLNNKFKAAYHSTIHDYCTLLRMRFAKQLLEKEGMLFSDVYFKVGYNNESSFRYAYNKFWKKAT